MIDIVATIARFTLNTEITASSSTADAGRMTCWKYTAAATAVIRNLITSIHFTAITASTSNYR